MESSLSSRLRLQQLAMMQMLNDLRFVVMSAILLIDDDLDLLYAYVQSLLPRPPRKRRFQALLRPHGSIWTAMSGDTPVWASYGPEFEDEKYYEHFRMDKHGFDYIYSKIKDDITPERDPRGRKGIDPRCAFAATLYYLASGSDYKVVCENFSMSKQTLQKWVPIVIEALDERLIPELIVFPSGRELHQVMRDFECLCHLPCVAGAIDGTFIELTKPSGQHADVYWCYKNKISILLLAVVDATGRFIFTDIGRPGSVGDAAAFRYSSLSDDLRERKLLSADEDRVINGVTVQPYLLGDDAFPLIPSLMKAYGGAPPPGSMEKVFNDAVIQGRRVVECAFGRCKARWRVLLNRSSLRDVKLLSNITSVCCALHNYCETQKLNKVWEGLEEKWLEDVRIDSADEGGPANRSGGMVDATAAEIRDALRDYLKDNYCSY